MTFDRSSERVAQFAVRIYREKDGSYRGTIDGWADVTGASLSEIIENSRKVLSQVLDGGFPDRTGIDPAGADLVVWFDIVLERRAARRGEQGPECWLPD